MMWHFYAPALWRIYGVPFDRIPHLRWVDFELMCRQADREQAQAER